ncbi:MAG: TIGR02444 family protein [Rhodospirillales bacterium]
MDNPFWNFSLKVYRQAGVPAACLKIQAGFGADVNILLYLCWLHSRSVAVSESDIEEIVSAADRWHRQIVVPLRQVRSKLKSDSHGVVQAEAELFRSSVKRLELEAEQLEQGLLYGLGFSDRPGSLTEAETGFAMRRAIEAYLATLSDMVPDEDALQTLVGAALD